MDLEFGWQEMFLAKAPEGWAHSKMLARRLHALGVQVLLECGDT